MLGRSFVRLRIASLAFQIKTKLNTSFAVSDAASRCSAVLPARQSFFVFILFVCCKNKETKINNCDALFDRLLFTPPHTVRVPYTINTHAYTQTALFHIGVSVCAMLCLFFVAVQYFDM